MIIRAELKVAAKEHIRGNIGILFLIYLLSVVIAAIGAIPIVGQIIIIPAIEMGLIGIFINQAKGEKPTVEKLFDGFNYFWPTFKVLFLEGVFVFLWSLLFVIPGIIKALSYSLSIYILAENKDMPALEAINKSKAMMHGHKSELFILGLSFIGWMLLGYVTLGIAYIWIGPYMQATMVNFYNKVKEITNN